MNTIPNATHSTGQGGGGGGLDPRRLEGINIILTLHSVLVSEEEGPRSLDPRRLEGINTVPKLHTVVARKGGGT